MKTVLLCLVLSVAAYADTLRVPAKVVSVYDGDTFTADAQPWPGITIRVTVRLQGVDAPEIRGQCEGERRLAVEARDALKALLGDSVVLEDVQRGKYAGRVVARVTAQGGRDATDAMIQAGYGRPYHGGQRRKWCNDGS